MLNKIKSFFKIEEPKPQKTSESYSPPPSDLAIIEADDMKFENKVIKYLNRTNSWGISINDDTGLIEQQYVKMENTHWSEFESFKKYARNITVRTTNWREKITIIGKDAIGTEVATVGPRKLRFFVPFETQLDFLEDKSNEDHNLMFERWVINNLSSVVKVINPAEIGIVTPDYRALYIEYNGAIYWNPQYQTLSPVEEVLISDFANFEFHSENPNNEKNHV